MKVSSDSIVFLPQEKHRSVTLTNNHDTNVLIYKVKTNNLNVIEASPNYGFIRAKSSVSLLIKTSSSNPFEAKLQIAYAEIGEKTSDFSIDWAKLKSEQIRKEQVRVSKLNKDLEEGKQKEGASSLEKEFKSIPSLQKIDSSNSVNPYELLQQKLTEQTQTNNKMRQKMEITEEKLREINQERLQIKVNKSIGIICEEYHTSFTTLLLFGLAIFVLGYTLAKYE